MVDIETPPAIDALRDVREFRGFSQFYSDLSGAIRPPIVAEPYTAEELDRMVYPDETDLPF